MERHTIKEGDDFVATLLIMNDSEFDEFVARMLPLLQCDSDALDGLIETEYLPWMQRSVDTEYMFKSYSVTTTYMIVVGPRGIHSAEIVLEQLEVDNCYTPFSLN